MEKFKVQEKQRKFSQEDHQTDHALRKELSEVRGDSPEGKASKDTEAVNQTSQYKVPDIAVQLPELDFEKQKDEECVPHGETDTGSSSEEEETYRTSLDDNDQSDTKNHAITLAVHSTIPRGETRVQEMLRSISRARKREDRSLIIQPVRNRVPPKMVRLATFIVQATKVQPSQSIFYEEPQKPQKRILLYENSSFGLAPTADINGPGPWSYSPRNKPLLETNAPAYTFGSKCYPEKTGGSRTSWAKSWFHSNHPWHTKVDYVSECSWPSPNSYPHAPTLGSRHPTMIEAPSYTFGQRQQLSFIKPDAHNEPAPNEYNRQNADKLILRRGPSYTHQFRREGTVLWDFSESNPGPAAYSPKLMPKLQKPAYTIQGNRREKTQVLGPYCSL